ncbi:Transcription repressor OFP14 [Bienertia sinuspersici]
MPKKIQKSLQGYLSKIKKQTPHLQFSHSSLSSTTSKILGGCKHPKSLSFSDRKSRQNHHDHHHQHHNDEAAATLEDIDKFLIENFKSLYGKEDHSDNNHEDDDDYVFPHNNKQKGKAKEYQVRKKGDITTLGGVGIIFDSPRYFTPPPDLCGSHRFFISPASSSSLIEEAQLIGVGTSVSDLETGSTSASTMDTRAPPLNYIKDDTSAIPEGIEDCIALLRVSPSPYEDFRRSMQEMLDAKINSNQRVDWDFLEELLFCYLRLNEKKQYRYILSAFVDLVVVLRQISSNRGPERSRKF